MAAQALVEVTFGKCIVSQLRHIVGDRLSDKPTPFFPYDSKNRRLRYRRRCPGFETAQRNFQSNPVEAVAILIPHLTIEEIDSVNMYLMNQRDSRSSRARKAADTRRQASDSKKEGRAKMETDVEAKMWRKMMESQDFGMIQISSFKESWSGVYDEALSSNQWNSNDCAITEVVMDLDGMGHVLIKSATNRSHWVNIPLKWGRLASGLLNTDFEHMEGDIREQKIFWSSWGNHEGGNSTVILRWKVRPGACSSCFGQTCRGCEAESHGGQKSGNCHCCSDCNAGNWAPEGVYGARISNYLSNATL